MYLEFYGLREPPFNLTPDPEYFFMSAGHKRALSYLTYGIVQRKGFMQLTGEVGSGKTMIVRRMLAELEEQAVTAYVLNPADTFAGLLRFILKDLDVPLPNDPDLSKTELLDHLYRFLLERTSTGTPVIIVFDEAQNLSMNVLEEIRMISNFETTKSKLVQIIFVGQPEFKELAASPQLIQLAQRISIRHHLGPLRKSEVSEYVDHRLHVAGGDRIQFTAMAKEIIGDYSRGIPRIINAVGDFSLLVGYVNETFVLNHRIVNEAIAELEGRALTDEDELAESEWTPAGTADAGDLDDSPARDTTTRPGRLHQRGRPLRRTRRVPAGTVENRGAVGGNARATALASNPAHDLPQTAASPRSASVWPQSTRPTTNAAPAPTVPLPVEPEMRTTAEDPAPVTPAEQPMRTRALAPMETLRTTLLPDTTATPAPAPSDHTPPLSPSLLPDRMPAAAPDAGEAPDRGELEDAVEPDMPAHEDTPGDTRDEEPETADETHPTASTPASVAPPAGAPTPDQHDERVTTGPPLGSTSHVLFGLRRTGLPDARAHKRPGRHAPARRRVVDRLEADSLAAQAIERGRAEEDPPGAKTFQPESADVPTHAAVSLEGETLRSLLAEPDAVPAPALRDRGGFWGWCRRIGRWLLGREP